MADNKKKKSTQKASAGRSGKAKAKRKRRVPLKAEIAEGLEKALQRIAQLEMQLLGIEEATEHPEEERNVTWRRNHEKILEAYMDFMKMKPPRKPSYEQLAEYTGLSIPTIWKHLKELKFDPKSSDLRILTDRVILSVYGGAMKLNPASQKLWFELMEGWSPMVRHGNADGDNLDQVIIVPDNGRLIEPPK